MVNKLYQLFLVQFVATYLNLTTVTGFWQDWASADRATSLFVSHLHYILPEQGRQLNSGSSPIVAVIVKVGITVFLSIREACSISYNVQLKNVLVLKYNDLAVFLSVLMTKFLWSVMKMFMEQIFAVLLLIIAQFLVTSAQGKIKI